MGLLSVMLEHPGELPALIQVRYAAYTATYLPRDPDLAFCYDMLNRVSRSFAVVIQQLHPQLKDSVIRFSSRQCCFFSSSGEIGITLL